MGAGGKTISELIGSEPKSTCATMGRPHNPVVAPFIDSESDGVSVRTLRRNPARPRLLDLFCCAGGAGTGYHLAGFDVVGVDIAPRPRYPFEFIQADCLTLDPAFLASFDAIHASPPCQAHTAMKTMADARPHLDLIPQTRAMLIASGLPYVIENVVGAPLRAPFMLCGTMFGLGVKGAQLRRHRLFETNFTVAIPTLSTACQHGGRTIGIYGEGCRDSRRKYDKTIPEFTVVDGREAMECPWMTIAELCEAIPPAYTKFIGERMLAHIETNHPHHEANETAQGLNGTFAGGEHVFHDSLTTQTAEQHPDAR